MKMMPTLITAIFTSFFSIATTAGVNWTPAEIEFTVNPGQGVLMPFTGSQGCTRGQGERKGCVRFAADTLGQIKFSLKGNPATNKCSDPGTQYVITKIELSHEGYLLAGSPTPVISEKGIFNPDAAWQIPSWLQDAFPGVDAKGVVYSASKDDASNQATIINLNNQPNKGGGNEKDIWYRISVTDCNDGSVLRSDPRLENDGTTS